MSASPFAACLSCLLKIGRRLEMSFVKPTRRLTSRTLKKALKAFVVPTVADRYHIIAIRCLWKVLNNDIWRASEQINGKRRQMELLIEQNPNVLLFVSSLTAQEQGQETRENDNEESGDEENEEDVHETDSYDTANKRVYPGVTFWIVVDIPVTCLSNVDINFTKMLLQSGLDVTSCKPIRPRGRNSNPEVFSASLSVHKGL